MAKLENRGVADCLIYGVGAPSFEHHDRNRPTREQVADDKLGEDIKTNYLVRDSLNETDRDREYGC